MTSRTYLREIVNAFAILTLGAFAAPVHAAETTYPSRPIPMPPAGNNS